MISARHQSRGSGSWVVILADLALILFITVLAGLVVARSNSSPARYDVDVETGQAVFRKIDGGPTLSQWLNNQRVDPRTRLTILGRHAPGDAEVITLQAVELWGDATRHGYDARLVIESGEQSKVLAQLAYDRARPDTAGESPGR